MSGRDDCPECRAAAARKKGYGRRSTISFLTRAATKPTGSAVESFKYRFDCDFGALGTDLAARFILNSRDEGMEAFLKSCDSYRDSCIRMLLDSWALSFLKPFMSTTSLNGLLYRGAMFVLSSEQIKRHLGLSAKSENHGSKRRSLMDIGAGDGGVTKLFEPYFDSISVTEDNTVMRWRLWGRGYRCLSPQEWDAESRQKYDVISCLNVLDRCDKPKQLIAQMRDRLEAGGKLLIALVLPFRPFVEDGSKKLPPSERLAVDGESFEEQVACFAYNVFEPLGLNVEVISRTPYLCQGDVFNPYYVLNDAVFVLSPRTADIPPPVNTATFQFVSTKSSTSNTEASSFSPAKANDDKED